MKKSEIRELVIKWKDLKRRSKNHDLSEEIKMIEHRYIMKLAGDLKMSLMGKVFMTFIVIPQN